MEYAPDLACPTTNTNRNLEPDFVPPSRDLITIWSCLQIEEYKYSEESLLPSNLIQFSP